MTIAYISKLAKKEIYRWVGKEQVERWNARLASVV
jgi:hypothetical protein